MKKVMIISSLLLTTALFILASDLYAETEIPLTATASSSYGSYRPNNAVDGNLSTYWRGQTPSWKTRRWWLRLDCANIYELSSISIWWYNNYGATDYDIQASEDGQSWTNLYTGLSSAGGSTNPHLVTYSLSGSARYVRLYIRRAEKTFPTIYEVKIFSGAAANQPPTAQASANPTSGVAPVVVKFTGSGLDPDGHITLYYWDFGDGATSTQQNPTYTYNSAAAYTATLTVTDNDGATDSDSVQITVTEAGAEIPHLIRFQGRLTNTNKVPLDGTFTLTFRLYDQAVGGSPLWQESQGNVSVKEGVVDVELGATVALNLPFDRQYWLGIEVGSDGEMTPRFKLTTVPYSFNSEQ